MGYGTIYIGNGFLNEKTANENRFIIVQHIDYSLEEYKMAEISGKLSLEQIFVQMINAVEELHKFGFLHTDIKPEIFRIKNHHVYIIDLEHARESNEKNNSKPQEKRGLKFLNPEFTSIKVLKRDSHGRGDDIESLGYSILSMIKPEGYELPWSRIDHIENYDKVLRLKCEFLGIKYPD